MRVVTLYGDRIEGMSLRFRLWLWWNNLSQKQICEKYWANYESNMREVGKIMWKLMEQTHV
ncbi:MAG TPA: hypothetical protein VEP90_23490 [Methylomirabilota bacterium]|nr:hypothetical protein [Methylomirabilota bacterium]